MRFIYTILVFLFSYSAIASIHEVKTMEEASRYFADADVRTLAAFDIDMVLIQPADPAFQVRNFCAHKKIAKRILSSLTKDEFIAFFGLVTVKSYPILIETYTNVFLENLRNRHIKTIAITANLTGSFDCKEVMQQWVSDRLALCGIDFSKSFGGEIQFKNLPTYRGNYMEFFDGILFCNGLHQEKGTLLAEFLQRVNYSPNKVIFIDDLFENLKAMEAALTKLGIEFIGLHYTGANTYLSPYIDEASFEKVWIKRAEEAKELVKSELFHILPVYN